MSKNKFLYKYHVLTNWIRDNKKTLKNTRYSQLLPKYFNYLFLLLLFHEWYIHLYKNSLGFTFPINIIIQKKISFNYQFVFNLNSIIILNHYFCHQTILAIVFYIRYLIARKYRFYYIKTKMLESPIIHSYRFFHIKLFRLNFIIRNK